MTRILLWRTTWWVCRGWKLGLFVGALSVLGCGRGDGVRRYDVSGSVTYQGKPVPAGYVLFEPDSQRGNTGPGGSATIAQGRYRTHMGAVGGPHTVRIMGLDGVTVESEDGMGSGGSPLFREYTTTVDLPRATSTQDFDVPSELGGKTDFQAHPEASP